MSEQAKQPSKLGISKDTQAKAGIPISAPARLDKRTPQFPNSWDFPVVKLVKVEFNPAKDVNRNGEIIPTPVLSFLFRDIKGEKQFTHIEFPLDDEDPKFSDKLDSLHKRIKHIFDETVGASRFKEGSMEGDTFEDLFKNVAAAFNAEVVTKGEGDQAKTLPLYYQTPVYLKLVYYQTRLQLPMFPNFIQRAHNGTDYVPCELAINPQYDQVEPKAKAQASAAGSFAGGHNAGFGGAADFGDFPSI